MNMTKSKQTLSVIIAISPLATLIGIELYIRNFDGWGDWAAAPLLLIPMVLSVSLGIVFMFDPIRSHRSGESIKTHLMILVLSFIPIGWLFIQRFLK